MELKKPNTNCIFFAGGKKFNTDATNSRSVLRLSKSEDGAVVIELKFTISKEEAEKSIFNFSELKVNETDINEKKPNMVFLEAYDQNLKPQDQMVYDGNFIITYDKGNFSEIILKGVVTNSGKTDHPKTDHPATGE
jgi:hypothetical protein